MNRTEEVIYKRLPGNMRDVEIMYLDGKPSGVKVTDEHHILTFHPDLLKMNAYTDMSMNALNFRANGITASDWGFVASLECALSHYAKEDKETRTRFVARKEANRLIKHILPAADQGLLKIVRRYPNFLRMRIYTECVKNKTMVNLAQHHPLIVASVFQPRRRNRYDYTKAESVADMYKACDLLPASKKLHPYISDFLELGDILIRENLAQHLPKNILLARSFMSHLRGSGCFNRYSLGEHHDLMVDLVKWALVTGGWRWRRELAEQAVYENEFSSLGYLRDYVRAEDLFGVRPWNRYMSVDTAYANCQAWHTAVNEDALRRREANYAERMAREAALHAEVLKPWLPDYDKDGISITTLTTWPEFQEEGMLMHHCVSSYWTEALAGYCSICTVRKEGEKTPIATLELHRLDGDISMAQVRGVCNSPIAKDTAKAIDDWFKTNKLSARVHKSWIAK